jgi:hypothetical protein
LMSERFTGLLTLPGATSIGWHVIKGFVEPIQLFAWIDASSARREPAKDRAESHLDLALDVGP